MAIHINNGFATFGTFVKFAGHRTATGLNEAAKATMDLNDRHLSVATDVKLSPIVNS